MKKKGFNSYTQRTKKPRKWVRYQPLQKLIISSLFPTLTLQGSQEAVFADIKVPGHGTGYCCSPLHRAQAWQWASPEGSWTLGRLRKKGPGWCGGDGGSGASDHGSAGSQTAGARLLCRPSLHAPWVGVPHGEVPWRWPTARRVLGATRG